jgi:GNAT superfamily N-acetyltransferase
MPFVCFRFGVDHALDATGLSVGRENRGLGLGQMLLEARLEMCRGLGIPLTKTMFTAIPSQKLAARVGFKVIKETGFPALLDKDGNKFFDDLHHTLQLSVYKFD